MVTKELTTGHVEIAELEYAGEPSRLFEGMVTHHYPFFLDTGIPDCHGLGHFSFIGVNPFMTLSFKNDKACINFKGKVSILEANPFDVLARVTRNLKINGERGKIPFTGGAVGYLAYDLGRFLETLPRSVLDDQKFPEMYFAFYDKVLAFDHKDGKFYYCRTSFNEKPPAVKEEAEQFVEALFLNAKRKNLPHHTAYSDIKEIVSNFKKDDYLRAVEKALEYIMAGDIYQVNLSQRFTTALCAHPWEIYKKLRILNRAPMSAYLGFEEISVLSSSPERFLKVKGRTVETKPIKGTRRRGENKLEDEKLKEELSTSEKDRAELNMIVDLERNDLGRVCEYGSVKVRKHAVVESYATVHHLVSTVEGVLREDLDIFDLLKASFPGGSITGAPKIRAMEIIDELEPTARNLYTGAIGYIDFNGDADFNIAIRTILAGKEKLSFQVGGGIVADSDPEAEYQETLIKGKAIFETLKTISS
mgnify:CR=1 FL=1